MGMSAKHEKSATNPGASICQYPSFGHGHVRNGNGEVGRIIPNKRRLTTISVTGSAVEPETVLSHANEGGEPHGRDVVSH